MQPICVLCTDIRTSDLYYRKASVLKLPERSLWSNICLMRVICPLYPVLTSVEKSSVILYFMLNRPPLYSYTPIPSRGCRYRTPSLLFPPPHPLYNVYHCPTFPSMFPCWYQTLFPSFPSIYPSILVQTLPSNRPSGITILRSIFSFETKPSLQPSHLVPNPPSNLII